MEATAPHCHPAYLQYMYGPNKGKYMGGVISSDDRGSCKHCGDKFVLVLSEEYDEKIPRCSGCNRLPSKLRVVIYFPGKGNTYIRNDQYGKRITKPHEAVNLLKHVRNEITNRTFDITRYYSKKQIESLKVKYFVDQYISEKAIGGISHRSSKKTVNDMKNIKKLYLDPFFGDLNIRSIRYSHLHEFMVAFPGSHRQKVKALQMLRPVLKLASKFLEGVVIPIFPTLPKANMRTAFIDDKTVHKIVSCLTLHKEAIQTAILYLLRPCEVRALQWRDIDWQNKTITIQRHFSKNELLEGRKSATHSSDRYNKLTFELFPEMIEILKTVPRSVRPDEFIFRTRDGRPLSEDRIRRAWIKAVTDANVNHVQMYEGTRHAGATQLRRNGVSQDVIKELLGHTTTATTDRYAKSDLVSLSKVLKEQRFLRISCVEEKTKEKAK